MIVRINCFVKEIAFTKRWTRHDVNMIVRIIVSSKRLHLSCYWLSNTFSLYDLIVFWSLYNFIFWFYFLILFFDFTFWLYFLTLFFDFIFCQCRCFLIDMWILAKFFFLVLTFSESETTSKRFIFDIFHALFFDKSLWNSRKINSYQFSLNWNDNLSCDFERDVCLQFLIHVRMSRFCQNVFYFAIFDLFAC